MRKIEARLYNGEGEIVCHIIKEYPGNGPDDIVHIGLLHECNKALNKCFRDRIKETLHKSLADRWSKSEVEAAINGLIALGGWKIDYDYSGWE